MTGKRLLEERDGHIDGQWNKVLPRFSSKSNKENNFLTTVIQGTKDI